MSWLILFISVTFHEFFAVSFNIMILNDKENTWGIEASMAALDFVSHNASLDLKIDNIVNVDSSNCDEKEFFNNVCRVYNEVIQSGNGPHLILDLTRCQKVSLVARSFLQTIGLPAVSTSQETTDVSQWLIEETGSKLYVELLHPQNMIPQIVKILTISRQLTSAAILYDNTFGILRKSEFVLRDIPVRQIVINVQEIFNLRELMVELKELDIFNYFILGTLSTIRNVMDSAYCSKYYDIKFAWYIITQEPGYPRSSCHHVTFLFIRPDQRYVTNDKIALSILSMDISSMFYFNVVFKSVLASRLFYSNNNWVSSNFSQSLCSPHMERPNFDRTIPYFYKYFKQIKNPILFSPLHLNQNGRGYMDFVMRLDGVTVRNTEENMEHIGLWTPGSESTVTVKNADNTTSRVIYQVVVALQTPFVIRTIDEAGNEVYSGYCIDLLKDISQLVGFDYEIYTAPDNSFGTMNENGEWGGLIKEIMDKKADIGMSCVSITAEREIVVEFTVPIYDLVGMAIMMKRSSPQTSQFKFLTAIGGEVWLCVLVIYIFASFLLWLFGRLSPHSAYPFPNQDVSSMIIDDMSFKDCLWFCMTSLTPQGCMCSFSSLPQYIVVGTWWLFAFVIVSSYTANLAAFLTVSRLDTRIQSLTDLARQSGISYAPSNGSSGMAYFERMAAIEQRLHDKWKDLTIREQLDPEEKAKYAVWEYPVSTKYTRLWKSMKEAGLPLTMEDARDRVLASRSTTDGFAFIGVGPMIRYMCSTNCDLQMVGEEFNKLPLGIALQRNSPLTDSFNKAIVQLMNERRLEKLKEIWWAENPDRIVCEQHDELTDEGIYLSNIGGVFALIIIGFMLACFTLVFEYYDPKHHKINTNLTSLRASSKKRTPKPPEIEEFPFHGWTN